MAKSPSPDRVLVIQTAFLGDIVLATSFLVNLRRLLPNAEIRFLTTPAGAKILLPNSLNITPISFDKRGADSGLYGFLRTAKKLKAFGPDLVFCLHRSLRSTLLARVAGGVSYGFFEAAGSVLLNHSVPRPKNAFEAEKNHALLLDWAPEKAKGLPVYPDLKASEGDHAEAVSLLAGLEGFVALAPSSVWATKRWPADRFARLAEMLWEKNKLRCVLVGGSDPTDLEVAKAVMDSISNGRKNLPIPINLVGKTSLGALKSILALARLVVANDSAPMHVAIAMGTPVLGVFGPTTKSLGFFPLAPEGKWGVAEHRGLDCRPCGLHGHDACPRAHFRCMLELAPEAVYREAERLLCP